MGKIFKLMLVVILLAGAGLAFKVFYFPVAPKPIKEVAQLAQQVETQSEQLVETWKPQPEQATSNFKAVGKVPFTPQAPTGNWSDPLFQNGCEEASILMAVSWLKNTDLTPALAEQEIRNISNLEIGMLGFAVDTNVDDSARLMQKYYPAVNLAVQKDFTSADLVQRLAQGSIALVPMDGKMLGNPHYTPPGPDEHMVVVIGYDAKTKEFITNDPGTKFGSGYRYGEKTFMNAIWNYPTGSQHTTYPGSDQAPKAMIVVSKK